MALVSDVAQQTRMMSDIEYEDAIKQAELSKYTIDSYIRCLRRLKTISGLETIESIIHNPVLVNDKLLSVENESTKYSYMVAVMSAIKHVNRPDLEETRRLWIPYAEKLNQTLKIAREARISTEHQEETYVPWEEVLARRDALEVGSTEHVYMTLVSFATRRQRDYYSLKIYRENMMPEKLNEGHVYIPTNTNHKGYINVVLGKTLREGEVFYEELPNNVVESMRVSVTRYPRSHLFMGGLPQSLRMLKNPRKKYTEYNNENAFQAWGNRMLGRLFEKDVTMVTLRHSHAVHNFSFPEWTDKMLEVEARLMASGVENMERYALQYGPNPENTIRSIRFPPTVPVGSPWEHRFESMDEPHKVELLRNQGAQLAKIDLTNAKWVNMGKIMIGLLNEWSQASGTGVDDRTREKMMNMVESIHERF
jgi:hypothetical protein